VEGKRVASEVGSASSKGASVEGKRVASEVGSASSKGAGVAGPRKAGSATALARGLGMIAVVGKAKERVGGVPQPAPPPPTVMLQGSSKTTAPAAAELTAAQQRRILVASASSEYERTETDSGSWESDSGSVLPPPPSKPPLDKAALESARLREAAVKAQRQRELFVKVPKRSYSNLASTQSVGLLSALLNPDPHIFPPEHPYRASASSQDLKGLNKGLGQSRVVPPQRLQTSKSSAAVPLVAQATTTHALRMTTTTNGARKGRPAHGQEMEDSDSGEENVVQVSTSIAQQRLAALAGRRSTSNNSTAQTKTNTPLPSLPPPAEAPLRRPPLPAVKTTAIPFGHLYNLPAPVAPSTPRTTRRHMLSTELSESMRRQLLWSRQVSRTSMLAGGAVKRSTSSMGMIGGRLRPLTTLDAGGSGAGQAGERQGMSEEGEERWRAAVARNKSWADDYHYKGW
jgi:hypothetical protein